jgi:hypothetical protein
VSWIGKQQQTSDGTLGQKRYRKLANHSLSNKSDGVTLAPKQLPYLCVDLVRFFAQCSTCDDADEKKFFGCFLDLMDANYLGALQAGDIIAVSHRLQFNAPEAEYSSLAPPKRSASKQSTDVKFND